jgi:hypothetical protein
VTLTIHDGYVAVGVIRDKRHRGAARSGP